jgi:GNAT acetyltransferase-like protein
VRTFFRAFEGSTVSDWDQFNEDSPTGTIFTSSSWLTALHAIPGLYLGIVVVELDGRWICGVPLAVRKKGPFWTALPVGASPYFGIVVSPSIDRGHPANGTGRVITLLASEILNHVHYVEIPNVPGLKIRAPFGWEIEERKTSTRNLRSATEPSKGDKELRYELRRAERADLRVETPGDPDAFLKLLRNAFEAKRLDVPVSRIVFQRLYNELKPRNRMSIYLASRSGELAAGAVILRDAHAHYYWIAATNPVFRSTGASYLLLNQILRDLQGTGPGVLDLVGANVPSVARFKSHFASETQTYSVLKAHSSLAAKLTRRVYQRIRRVGRPR